MDIIIYQNNTGSAPAIHWWLSQELNIGPELYAFNDGYCRPRGHHVGGVVIEDSQSPYHEKHRQSINLLESQVQQNKNETQHFVCLLYTSPSPRDRTRSRMPSSA